MKIKTNVPKPYFRPPATYDIVGLTRAEIEHIRDAVGAYRSDIHGTSIFTMLEDALRRRPR